MPSPMCIIRVLYGRLQRHGGGGGHNAGGKVGVAIRRGAVLRFLGSCGSHEVGEFIKLILTPFQSLLGKSGRSLHGNGV